MFLYNRIKPTLIPYQKLAFSITQYNPFQLSLKSRKPLSRFNLSFFLPKTYPILKKMRLILTQNIPAKFLLILILKKLFILLNLLQLFQQFITPPRIILLFQLFLLFYPVLLLFYNTFLLSAAHITVSRN